MFKDTIEQILTHFMICTYLFAISATEGHEPVYNFYCFKNSLVFGLNGCTWEYTVHDLNDKTVFFIWRNGNSSWYNIEIQPPNRTSIYNLNIGTINLIVGINVTSKQQGSMVFTSELSDVWVVQLPSLVGLTGTALNTSCVVLSWETSMYGGFEKELNVNCTSTWGEQKDGEFIIYRETKAPVCRLLPGRVYRCSAKIRVVTLDKKYPSNNPKYFWWSKYSTTSVKTKNDVPGSSPKTTAGAYSWESTMGCHTTNNKGHVWVYWKPIDPWYNNGELIGTKISYNTSEGEVSLQVNKSQTSFRLELPCNQCHVIYVRAVNDVVESKVPSTLFIDPPQRDNLGPELIVEVEDEDKHQNTNVRYLEWNNQNKIDDIITVFYAAKLISGSTEDAKSCDPGYVGPIDWKIANNTVNNTQIVLDDRPYCYALTLGNIDNSTGIYWTACVYIKDKVPKSPENIRMNRSSNKQSGAVLLEWNKIECSDDQPYIKWYEIGTCSDTSHCSVDVRLPSNTSAVSLNKSSIEEPMVAVRAVTRFGVSGNWSHPLRISAVITESATRWISSGQIAGVVMGVLGLIFITVFLTIGVRKYRRRLYNLRIETLEVIPDIVQQISFQEEPDPTDSEIYQNHNRPRQEETQQYKIFNAQEKVIDNSESTGDSYVRCDNVVMKKIYHTNDTGELNSENFENTGVSHFKNIDQRSNGVSGFMYQTFDYMSVSKTFPTEKHQELHEDEFLQNDTRTSDESNDSTQHQSDRLSTDDLQESDHLKRYVLQEADTLEHKDEPECDGKTKTNSMETGMTKPLDMRKSASCMSKENIYREINNPNKNGVKMQDNVIQSSNYADDSESKTSMLIDGYVQHTVLKTKIPKQMEASSNTVLSIDNIALNAVMSTSRKPLNGPRVLNTRRTSENSESSKSNKVSLVGDYVTSMPTETFHDNNLRNKILNNEEMENKSYKCFENDIVGTQKDKETNEIWLVEMTNRVHEQSDSSIFSCSDSGESEKENDMSGYIDQATAAEIIKRHISAENVKMENEMQRQMNSDTTFDFPGTLDSDGNISYKDSGESEKDIKMEGYIDHETAADIICNGIKYVKQHEGEF